jgi:hypothetical protein
MVEEVTFRFFNPLIDKLEQITPENDYVLLYFGIFPFKSMSVADVQKLRSKKWERLKGTKLSTFEIDIIWRLWNNCLITFKIANKMGLMST